jgi:hypothetical protein
MVLLRLTSQRYHMQQKALCCGCRFQFQQEFYNQNVRKCEPGLSHQTNYEMRVSETDTNEQRGLALCLQVRYNAFLQYNVFNVLAGIITDRI